MEKKLFKTPQVHIIGKIKGGENFKANKIFLRYQIKTGLHNFSLLKGKADGETFLAAKNGEFIPLEHPIDLHYIAKAIRGWPKMILEVWEEDDDGSEEDENWGSRAEQVGQLVLVGASGHAEGQGCLQGQQTRAEG